jgi:uncharacterized protein (DUF1800 family)
LLPTTVALGLWLGASCPSTAQATVPADRDEIVHVLNRITFGPRQGDVERVEKMGLHNYIEQQLHPETIDDSAVEAQIAQFELLQMSSSELTQLLSDTIRRINQKQHARNAAKLAETAANPPGSAAMAESDDRPHGPPPSPADQPWKAVAAIGQLEQAKLFRAVYSERQLQEVLVDFWNNHFNIDAKKGACEVWKIVDDRDVIRPHIWGRFRDLLEASAKSPAMLHYLDNATNVLAGTGDPGPPPKKTASSGAPAMPGATTPAGANHPMRTAGGINENYAREIMELHTIGVDGGYTQQDVQEVARCFTGWTVNRRTGTFEFHGWQHDNGAKMVLGHAIPAGGGIQDGETVLDLLCAQPACARFISRELCERFVSDDPPDALVERIAGVFRQSGGDLRRVTEAILTSPEFLSPANYGNKIKSPLEFAVSAVRATRATLIAKAAPPYDKVQATNEGETILGRIKPGNRLEKAPEQSLNYHIYEFGEPLFACSPPTGYPEISRKWVSASALIDRLNFAMTLTQQKVSDIRFDARQTLGGIDLDQPDAVIDQCVASLLQNKVSPATRQVLSQAAVPAPGAGQTVDPSKLIALVIGSPEFQRK